ncbi:hypothetical protein PO909_008989 [Leuciscus waleckii]
MNRIQFFFFLTIEDKIPKIDDHFKKLCEEGLKLGELDEVIKKIASDRSPGPDGLTANFYKHFWEEIKGLLFDAIIESIDKKELMTTMKQGLIKLIPKPEKDKRILNNLRPITLLNTDYKLLTMELAFRLKVGLSKIISNSQSGFMKGRLIHNNIRLVLDLIDYNDLVEDDAYILFLDFQKAFYSIEHSFIYYALEYFGFGEYFLDIIKMLHTDISSCVSLPEGTTPRFNICRGIRQGCSLSPLLFIIVAELLSIWLKNSEIEGINIDGKQILISQLADDTTLFLKNKDEIPVILQRMRLFSQASGLTLNLNKCELLSIHDSSETMLYNIPVKKEVRYLGIWVSKDSRTSNNKNIQKPIEKSRKILNNWLQRDLTLFGRSLLTKTELISRLIYPAYLSIKNLKEINTLIFNFIWKNKHHYIKKSVVMNNYESGGLNFLDFNTLNNTFKMNWAKHFLKNPVSIWNFIPHIYSLALLVWALF